jgi:hypothetical protein
MEINGIKLYSVDDLINMLYYKITVVEEDSTVMQPSCDHYPDCEKLNIQQKTTVSYKLKDLVDAENGFPEWNDNYPEFVDNLKRALKKNNYAVYIDNYEFWLVSSFTKGNECMWITEDGDKPWCLGCYYDSNRHTDIDPIYNPFYICTLYYGHFGDEMLEFIKNNLDSTLMLGSKQQLYEATMTLNQLANKYPIHRKIEVYKCDCPKFEIIY